MQTILGAGGAIGTGLAKELTGYTDKIRLVSRNPEKVNAGDELFPADLTDGDQVMAAVRGSEIIYLTVGLPYSINIWRSTWPVIMRNVIDACISHKAKLVFFDNIYMYDPDFISQMTEDTPLKPASKKGEIRAALVRMIMEEVNAGRLEAQIARSADFYGPSITNSSILTEIVFNYLSKGKKAMWLCAPHFKHSFTYTPDAARATALLGNTADTYNQVWHIPTAKDPYTGKQWIEAIAKELNVDPKFQVAGKFMVRASGIFSPVMKEMYEMLYQYDRDYIFDSSKFEKRFSFQPTSYKEGIKEIVKTDYS